LLLLVAPILTNEPFILNVLILCMVYAVVISAWDLTMGYTGIFNFGHFSLFAIGAYTSAILSKSFGASPWLGLLLGGLVTALASLLLALPTLRLKGIYFALFSFAFQQILYSIILFNAWNLTGGSLGVVNVPSFRLGSLDFGAIDKTPVFYLALAIFAVSTLGLYLTVKSPIGLALQALRDSEQYAISRGIDPYRYKVIAVVISALFTGVAGAFYAHYFQVIGTQILGWDILSLGLAMLVLGGLGTLFGPIASAFALTGISEYFRGIEAYRFLIIAGITVAVVVLLPSGFGGLVGWRAKTSE